MYRNENRRKLTIGYCPIRRDNFPDPVHAIAMKDPIYQRIREIVDKCGDVELVMIDDVADNGLLWRYRDVAPVIALFKEKNVDGIFFPHCNFGQEEVVAQVAKAVGKPVLLWGPRDTNRDKDTQCGLFATSRSLSRYGVPFTYIENCWLDSPILEKGIDDFLRVVSVVKAFRGMRIAQLGVRPRQFLSMKVNESELLEKFGIEVVPIWPEEVTQMVEKLKRSLAPADDGMDILDRTIQDYPEKWDPRVVEVISELKASVDYADIGEEKMNQIGFLIVAMMELCRINLCSAIAVECWAYSLSEYGIESCFAMAELFDRGLPAACETDIHAGITALMLEAATRYESPAFIADLTIRDPEDDNAELLWHCGPFAKSLIKEGVKPKISENGKGCYEIKHGPITAARFDQENGNYKIFVGEGKGIDGPATFGNYVWFQVKDWPAWERKLIYGPYVHHASCIHGNCGEILKEACKYLGGVQYDGAE